jgi:hypothetical protein
MGVLELRTQLGLRGLAERQRRLGFHMVACIESLNHGPSPTSLFIEHANELSHHSPISTLIRLGSNPCRP